MGGRVNYTGTIFIILFCLGTLFTTIHRRDMYYEFCSDSLNADSLHVCGLVQGCLVDITSSTKNFMQTTIPTPNTINILVHAFTAAGVLPSQYK